MIKLIKTSEINSKHNFLIKDEDLTVYCYNQNAQIMFEIRKWRPFAEQDR